MRNVGGAANDVPTMDHHLPDPLATDPSLHELVSDLTAPATDAELAGGEATVVRMSRITRQGRHSTARLVATSAAALLLFTGAAAAATGGSLLAPLTGDDSADEVEVVVDDGTDDSTDVTDDDTEVTEPDDVVEDDEPTAEDPSAEVTAGSIFDDPAVQAACDEATTHGQFVSGIAHDKVDGVSHGARVSEAAQSDCGKTADDSTDDDESDDESDDGDEAKSAKSDHPTQSQRPDHAGNGNGKSGKD